MPRSIPSPEFIHETIEGSLIDLPGGVVLVAGAAPDVLKPFPPMKIGEIVMRYGISYNIPPQDALVPGLFASERGAILVGREAWDLMLSHYQLYPRADIVGFRTNGGDAQVFLRELDWGAAIRVFAYAATQNRMPLAEPKGLYIGDGAAPTPELLRKYLPQITLERLIVMASSAG